MRSNVTCIGLGSRSRTSGSSTPKLKAQKQLKFGSQSNTESGPKILLSGPFTRGSVTGISLDQKKEKSEKPRPLSRLGHNPVFSTFIVFWLLLIFAASATQTMVNFATHNLHGFSKSANYLNHCIQSHGGIWFIQEHWLAESQLNQLQSLNAQFVARSGMEDAVSSGVYRGRPFGGVAICWLPELSHVITPISDFKHKRVVAVELNTDEGDFVLISIYMPFFNSSRREQTMAETIDALSMVELIIDAYPQHYVVIGGDLNTELRGESPFDNLWCELMTKKQFTYCDQYVGLPNFTYRHDSLNQTKFNDHFIVSKSLIDQGLIRDHLIIDLLSS